jgi:hypothetical protein
MPCRAVPCRAVAFVTFFSFVTFFLGGGKGVFHFRDLFIIDIPPMTNGHNRDHSVIDPINNAVIPDS